MKKRFMSVMVLISMIFSSNLCVFSEAVLYDSKFESIIPGIMSTAVMEDGSLWRWGASKNGIYLGNGTTDGSLTPLKIMTDVKEYYSYVDANFAIKEENSLWSWGSNDSEGILGNGTTDDSLIPIKILSNVRKYYKNCYALDMNGTLWGWGKNYYIGDGTSNANHLSPVKIAENVKEAYVDSDPKYIIKNDGSLWGWGMRDMTYVSLNHQYEYVGIGDGTCDSQLSPVKILDNVKEIFLSSYRYGTSGGTVTPYSAFAIKNDNTLWAWGGNQIGQLVDGTTEDRLAPVKVMDDVKKIAHRYGETDQWFALKTDDTLWGWGVNYFGTLGVGRDRVNFEEPVKIMNDVKNVFADNYDMTFAVKQDGSLWGWGVNYENSLGVNSDEEYVMSPTKIMDNVEVFMSTDAFNYGENLKYAIKTDGSFWHWGYENEDGENITNISTPQKISDNVVKCAVGVYGMNFFIKEDGTLWGWGYNDEGTLGDGTNITRQNPVEIKAYKEIIEGDEYTINSINVLQQSVRASVTKNKDISAILILSSKSEDGTIIDVNYEYLSLSKGDTENVDLELNTKGADYVSGYIWSRIDKMQPVSKEIIKNIN